MNESLISKSPLDITIEEFAKANKISRSKLSSFAQIVVSLHAPVKRTGRKASDSTMQHRALVAQWVANNRGKEFTTEDIVQAVGCHKAEANNALKKLDNVHVVGTLMNSGKRGRKPQIFKAM